MKPFIEDAKIYLDQVSSNARLALENTKLILTSDPNKANLLWIRKGYESYYKKLNKHQYLNHYPNENLLCNKGKLTENLKQYHAYFYPETYCLYQEQEIDDLLKYINVNKTSVWILKPVELSKGRGIKIISDNQELQSIIENADADRKIKFDHQKPHHYIAQQYIKNPLLLDGKKSEIRIYWLLASLNPLIAFIYPQGTVRLTSKIFKLDDFDNPLIHVTNIYQQKKHSKEAIKQRLKWSFDELDAYLFNKKLIIDQCFSQLILLPQIKKILLNVIKSVKDKFDHINDHYFGLYGADFILDDNLKPWLLEIQKSPGLSFEDPIKKRIIPPMLYETINIILEMAHKKQTAQKLNHVSSVDNFEYIINEAQ